MPEPIKNMYNQAFFDALTGALAAVYPAFDTPAFLARIYDDQWEARELKERIRHITVTMRGLLPGSYRDALAILREAAPRLPDVTFGTVIFPDFVELYGLDDWQVSIPALEQFTQQSSAEFAVRPFILQDPARMMAQMLAWTGHENHHVRRLASEGCRPRLPWAIALPVFKADPSPILPILERLKADPSEYVRRSVANNLNDIAKDNPSVVIEVLKRWQADDTPEMRWITARGLRTLVKDGSPEALALLGHDSSPAVTLSALEVKPPVVAMGAEMTFSFTLESTGEAAQNLLIDYVVHLLRANGKHIPKVFKLTRKTLGAGERLDITKKHSFRPVTTRRYYPGEHMIAIQVNGVVLASQSFTLNG